ncbi:neogenin isoform X2 [Diorhabda carinulata]|uniref:neogenin isoform X2 n=1 Tax=Diorhabda carinulata TaxID=1163345 RepID=UPI0025A012BF|nr:neogenin isoform X2 [Diorhabda carinulata]
MLQNSLNKCYSKFIVILVIASVLTSIQSSIEGHILEFTVEPSDTVVESGQSAVLDCVVRASYHQNSVLIQWLDQDGSTLSFIGDSYRSQLTNGSLYITSVVEEQRLTGTYQCKATLPNVGSIVSRIAKLTIANLVRFQEEPRDLSVYIRQRAYFACHVIGTPPPRIKWLKDERPLIIDELRMTILPSGALEIDEVIESDQGSYRCNASGLSSYKLSNKAILHINRDQEESLHITAPNFIAKPLPGTYVEGQNVSLDCAANGYPVPTIIWLKGGYPIDMNDLDSRFKLVGTTNSLRIIRIQEEDGGTYQCRAKNQEDIVDASALIQIQVPPRFLVKPQDKIEHSTKDVELECAVYGIPDPEVRWFKNGELVKYSDYYKLVEGHNLKIMGLMTSDSGLFQCFATNAAGNIQAVANLKVLATPEKKKSKLHSKKVPHQQSISLFSSLKSDSDATLGDINFTQLTKSSNRTIFDPHTAFNSLKSSESNDTNNNLGDIQFAFTPPPPKPIAASTSDRKLEDGLPGPPQDLRAPIVKARFVILSWKPPLENGDNIISYSIYYRQNGSDRERYQNTNRSKLEEISIGGLLPGRVYHFRIVPNNALGPGESSEPLTITTQNEEHVASAPLAFNAYATSPRNIYISWQPPETPNGRILKYTIYYMETSSSIEHNVDVSDSLNYDLNDLNPYTEYSIWVVAQNENGGGAATEEKTVRTYSAAPTEPPTNITAEPSSMSITVRWEPPPPEAQNGIILGYKIKWRRSGKGKAQTYTTQPSERHYVINDLEKGAIYQIKLWAMNGNGTGPGSEWLEVKTFQNDVDESQVPDKPAYIKVRPTFDKVFVMWSPPLNQKIRVRNYILGWGKGIPDMYSVKLDERNRTYVVDRLEPNSEYVLSLSASNDVGAGAPIYTQVRTQDEPPPEPTLTLFPPMGLKAQVLSTTSVVLYWTDPTLKQSQYVRDNRYYIVKITDDKMRKPRYMNVTDLNAMVDELKPNTFYEFSVKLVKGRKESSWSMVAHNRTWELPLNVSPRELDAHFKDEDSHLVELSWQPPKTYTGRITGYVILYTDNKSLSDPEWNASAVKGDVHSSIIYNLKPFTQYYFKVQARNSRGYGPFSSVVTFRTGQNSSGVFSNEVLLYTTIAGCLLAVGTIAGVVAFFCCRRTDPNATPDRTKKGYQKGSKNTQNIPPDLWIHHDQMELKAMEKRHSHNDGASSSAGAVTLPRSIGGNEYEPHEPVNTNSLDKGTYVPNYVADDVHRNSLRKKPIAFPVDNKPSPREPIATPINTATLSQSSTDSTPSSRQPYGRSQYSLPSRTQVPFDSTIPHSQATENVYISHPVAHGGHETANPLSSGYIGHPQPTPTGGGFGTPPATGWSVVDGTKRLQAQGHPLKSFTVPAPPPISAPGTPQPKHIVTVRPTTSPYKKVLPSGSPPTNTSGVTPTSRINPSNPPPHTADEVQRLQPSHSTEELNQEMANLEGLMLTLNAITANEFEC